jgi:hypothetical protein
MINEHIISTESGFDATYDFNTKARYSKGEIFMNLKCSK